MRTLKKMQIRRSPQNYNTGNKNLIDTATKIITAVGAIIAGIAIPLVININAERNRESQLYIQIMSQREQSDSALRAQMFNALITSYFKTAKGEGIKDPEEQIMYLQLLTSNFQEFFDAKPLFEDFDKKIKGERRERLRQIGMEVANRQINLLSKPENRPVELKLCVNKTKDCPSSEIFKVQGKRETYTFSVELLGTNSSGISVRVMPLHGDNGIERIDFKPIEFNVSFYGTPFMNNTKLMDGSRFSIILSNLDNDRKKAIIKVLTFPEEFMSLRDRPYFDEMLLHLGREKKSSWFKDIRTKIGLN